MAAFPRQAFGRMKADVDTLLAAFKKMTIRAFGKTDYQAFVPGFEVLWEERSFRRYQSGQNGGKAVIWATCNHTAARL